LHDGVFEKLIFLKKKDYSGLNTLNDASNNIWLAISLFDVAASLWQVIKMVKRETNTRKYQSITCYHSSLEKMSE
jgi:hypothetical protein